MRWPCHGLPHWWRWHSKNIFFRSWKLLKFPICEISITKPAFSLIWPFLEGSRSWIIKLQKAYIDDSNSLSHVKCWETRRCYVMGHLWSAIGAQSWPKQWFCSSDFLLLDQLGAAVTAYKCPSCSMSRFSSIDHVMDCHIDGDDKLKTFVSIVGNF